MTNPWLIRNAFNEYTPGDWIRDAICAQANPEDFFPEQGASAANAKKVCKSCPVQKDCLDYALNSPTALFGVWGGMTALERRLSRRRHA